MLRMNHEERSTGRSAVAVAWVFITSVSAWGATPLGTASTYQGQLKQDGINVNETCDCQFTLWDDLAVGVQIGPTLTFDGQVGNDPSIAVVDGLFSVELDFGAGAFDGDARWLEIAVTCPSGGTLETLSPRQPLTAAPYALYALDGPGSGSTPWTVSGSNIYYDGARVGIGTTDPAYRLDVRSPTPRAIFGWVTNPNGTTYGVVGQNASTEGTGVLGNATANSGTTTGVLGFADSPNGQAVHGFALSNSGQNYGVRGQTNSPAGYAAYFTGAAGSRNYFERNVGIGTASPGFPLDVQTANANRAISGLNTTPVGTNYAVHGEVTGEAGFGVYGRGLGPNSRGVGGLHQSTTGDAAGVWGATNSFAANAAGVRGEVLATSGAGPAFGVHGRHLGERGTGVRGDGLATGVHGVSTALDGIGVHGQANGTIGQGVRGEGSTGVYGMGDASGVTGEAGDSSSFGVWAIGSGGRLSQPALRADNVSGPAIYALGSRGVEGEGTEFGVRGVTFEDDGVGGSFTNFADGGVALRANGVAEVDILRIMGGADLAEHFEFSEPAEPGSVVAIDADRPGKLCLSRKPYNKRVAGVVSGANKLSAGVVLGEGPPTDASHAVALSGRVWVRCEAVAAAIEPGDLLTTSDEPGMAMKAADHERAQGAILGKAMTGLESGTGLVLVLVTLQ